MAGRRLKVFQTTLGFYDTVVAAPSQAAALRAWGVKQNLFALGQASVTTDEAARAAASDCPETPLRRPVGAQAPFALVPVSLPEMPPAPAGAARRTKAKAKPKAAPKRASRPPPDRGRLDAAERALEALAAGRKAEEAAFRREEAALAERRSAAQKAYVGAHRAAAAALKAAQAAYRKAGGTEAG